MRTGYRIGLILAACLGVGGAGIAFAQVLEIVPNRVLADESASIRVRGLSPNENISIRAELVDGADKPWLSLVSTPGVGRLQYRRDLTCKSFEA